MIKITNDSSDTNRGQFLHYHFDSNEWCQKWEEKLDLSKAAMAEQIQKLEITRQQVLAGELSPIAFHAQKRLFDVKLLSAYTEIPKRHIKKHFKPEKFSQLDEKTLAKYAEIFKISIEEINNVEI
jgi:hypothetical protein